MTESLIERASQLISHQRYNEAEKYIKEALSLDPSNSEAVVLLSLCKSELNQHEEAIKLIKQVIGQAPDNDYYLYLHSLFSFRNDGLADAKKIIASAISYNPLQADYFGLLSLINLNQKDWSLALENADKGLALDSENLTCLNSRSTALFKLDKKDDAFNTIREALNQDPENDYTHANIGWGLLEKGNHKKALEHFRESLNVNSENELAKAGLVEGLKARYWFYRIFLQYKFWIGNMKGKLQWVVILGFYFGSRFLNLLSESNPSLKPFLAPVLMAYTIFAISTWVITPLSNLFLRLNVYGRYALTENEIKASNFVGVSLIIGAIGAVFYIFTPIDLYFLIGFFGLTMMLPLASVFNPEKNIHKKILIGYTCLMAFFGIASIVFEFMNISGGTPFTIYLIAFVAYQFLANALATR